ELTVQRRLRLHGPAERIQLAQRAAVAGPAPVQQFRGELVVAGQSWAGRAGFREEVDVGAQETAEEFRCQGRRRGIEADVETAPADPCVAEEGVLDVGRVRRVPAAQ